MWGCVQAMAIVQSSYRFRGVTQGRATGAEGYRNVFGLALGQLCRALVQLLALLVGLGWEKLETHCGHGNSLCACVDYIASRSEEHTSELQSLMRISYAVFCLKKKKKSIKL